MTDYYCHLQLNNNNIVYILVARFSCSVTKEKNQCLVEYHCCALVDRIAGHYVNLCC